MTSRFWFLFIIVALILVPVMNLASEEEAKGEAPPDIFSLEEADNTLIRSLSRGTVLTGIELNLSSQTAKNLDQYIFYTLDSTDKAFNIRVYAGYFFWNRRALGLRFRYVRNRYQNTCIDLINQQVSYTEDFDSYSGAFFYKMYAPVFGSKRVYLVVQPEVEYTYGVKYTTRNDGGTPIVSHTVSNGFIAGVQIGFAIFPFAGLSLEARMGPLGFGYRRTDVTSPSGGSEGSSDNWFLDVTPRLYHINFMLTKYW